MPDHHSSDDDAGSDRLRAIAAQLSDEDFRRDEVPASVWNGIAAAMSVEPDNVLPLRRIRNRYWIGGAAAAAVAAIVIAGGVMMSDSDRETVAVADLSNAGLSTLGASSSGHVDLVRSGSSFVLHIEVANLPQDPSSYIEVWMIDRGVKGMVSLGPFQGNGDYAIPAAVNPDQFPVVDLSIEPSDGVPTHSSVSIVRGTMS